VRKITWAGIAGTILLIACAPISEPDTKTATPSLSRTSQVIFDTKATVSSASSASVKDNTTDSTALPTHIVQLIEHPLCLYSCPLGADDTNFLVDYTIFFLSANRETKFVDWVAYQVEVDNLSGGTHSRNWKRDPDIPFAFTLSPSDYKGASTTFRYDRGHQAPLADFSNHPDWLKINYLSNITPRIFYDVNI